MEDSGAVTDVGGVSDGEGVVDEPAGQDTVSASRAVGGSVHTDWGDDVCRGVAPKTFLEDAIEIEVNNQYDNKL